MDTSPLVSDEIDAGREFLKKLNDFRPVLGACWLLEDESETRYLFIALDGLTVENTGEAYSEVLRISQEMTDHYIDPFRVKLIGCDHPVTKALLEFYQRYKGRARIRVDGQIFAGRSFADLYIYPPLTT